MAQQNVERAVIFPAGMALAAEHYVDDTEALYANLRSFNRWFDETWGFNYQDKIYATALLSLRDLESSIAETEAIIEQGARLVLLPTGPAYGRSPGDPYFDPIYARLQEAGCTLVVPYPALLVLQRHLAGLGAQPRSRGLAHVGLAMDEHLRPAPDRGHPVRADLRQPVRPLPRPEGPRRRARRRVGPAVRHPHGQEPRHGSQRAVDRRKADRAAVADLPAARRCCSLSRGRHPDDRATG